MKTGMVAMIGVMLFGLAGLGADKPPERVSAESAATAPADRLEPFLRVVRQAQDVRTVMQTYARAQAVVSNSTELHRAYMRRMLKFGLPQIAHHAARQLVRLDEADGVAWGLIGYIHGRRGELAAAFAATVRAAELLGDDRSILNNAGQLAAWYDLEDELPKVADSARRTLDNLREQLSKKKPFDRAYEALKVAYARQAEAAAEVQKKMAAARAEAEAVQGLAQDIDYRLQQLNDEIDYHNRLIDSLWRELRTGYTRLYLYRDSDGRYVYAPNYGRQYHREYLRERIRDQEREIEKIRLKMRQVRREGQAVVAELAKKEAALEGLRGQIRQALARVRRAFRWDPPAVDGVVTAERDDLPPAVGPPKMKVPIDPQTEATQMLELAKLYLRHDMSEKALALLEVVAKEFPETKAAKQAQLLLDALKPHLRGDQP